MAMCTHVAIIFFHNCLVCQFYSVMALLSPQVLDELLIEILLDLFDDFDHCYLKLCFCFLLCIVALFSHIFSNNASSHTLVLGISLYYCLKRFILFFIHVCV